MSSAQPAPFLRDPITVPRKELIDHYRSQGARYRQLAERQQRSSVHQGLLELARQCDAMAKALAAPTTEECAKPELSKEELLLMLSQVIAEDKNAVPPEPVVEHSQSPALRDAVQELSFDQILDKIQRDIAEDRPAAAPTWAAA